MATITSQFNRRETGVTKEEWVRVRVPHKSKRLSTRVYWILLIVNINTKAWVNNKTKKQLTTINSSVIMELLTSFQNWERFIAK